MGLKKLYKDYFEYYPSEKRGVFYLLVIIVLWAVGLYVYSRMVVPVEPDYEFQQAVTEYYAQQGLTERTASDALKKSSPRDWNLFEFDPNLISQDSLILLGLPDYTARAIVNFRNSGGSFKTAKSLSKIYTLSEEDFNVVMPYVKISPAFSKRHPKNKGYNTRYREYDNNYSYSDSTRTSASARKPRPIVELNRADSAELRAVSGIGGYFAGAISRRRKALGGYYSFDQLLEIFKLDTASLDRVAPSLTLDTTLIQKIDINAVSLDELRLHPYFPYSLANSLVKMREAHGPYSKISDIKRSYLMNDSIFDRVKIYLEVNDKAE